MTEGNNFASKDEANALLQKIMALEGQVESLKGATRTDLADAVQEAVLETPEVFKIEHRKYNKQTGKITTTKTEELSLYPPSLFKLSLIAKEVAALMEKAGEINILEQGTVGFILAVFGDDGLRNHYLKIVQIAFDPAPAPNPADLSIPLEKVELLDAVRVAETIIQKSTPFFTQLVRMLAVGANRQSPAT